MTGEKDMNIISYSIWLIAPEKVLLWVSYKYRVLIWWKNEVLQHLFIFLKKLIRTTTYWELKEIVILWHNFINCNPSPVFAAKH